MSRKTFEERRYVGDTGRARPAADTGAREYIGYEGRLGDAVHRARDAARVALPSKPVLAAIAVLMVACIALGVVAYRTTFASGVLIERLPDAQGQGVPAEGLGGDGDVSYSETKSNSITAEELTSQSENDSESVTNIEICVYVTGCVNVPGVYDLPEGARVFEALDAAGGPTAQADTTAINLAQPLSDAQMVYVPAVGEQVQPAASVSPGQDARPSTVNVNTAGVEELTTLNGIGEVLAQAIVDERERNGPFSSLDDLTRVSGIGEKTLAKFADRACV